MSPSKFLEVMFEAERKYQDGEIDRSQRNTLVAMYLALDGKNVSREFERIQAASFATA